MFERGFGHPYCSFFRGLLHYYRLELVNLKPNSILHIAIFIHLCEAFLGVRPHFNLIHYLSVLHVLPSATNCVVVGGDGIQARNTSSYFRIPLHSSFPKWLKQWYFCYNPPPCLPDCNAKIVEVCPELASDELTKELQNDAQVQYLLKAIQELKADGVSGETIVWSFMTRGVQPIEQQAKPGWTYLKGDITQEVPDPADVEKITVRALKVLSQLSPEAAGKTGKAFNGRSTHPAVSLFSHIMSLLSLYYHFGLSSLFSFLTLLDLILPSL